MSYPSPLTLHSLFEYSVSEYAELPALTFVGQQPITFREYDVKVKSLIRFFEKLGIKPGDKVSILSQNLPNWGISYFAITYMGAVAVPLLPEFTSEEIFNVLEHSEANTLIVSEKLAYKLEDKSSRDLKNLIQIDDFSLMSSENANAKYIYGETTEVSYKVEEPELAAIIYTSGTTGKQKGVMLSQHNIAFDAVAARKVQYVNHTDAFLSILPLSHTYENTLGLVLPLIGGCCVYYLTVPVSPAAISEALTIVRPTLMLTVPLIIEKMYRGRILPKINEKKIVSLLYKVPYFRKKINLKAGKTLMEGFGGRLKFFGVGGAKLDPVVEKFLHEAKFPLAIGYGLTETAPFLAGSNPTNGRLQSTGPVIEGAEIQLNFANPGDPMGEIWAKGPNIMLGYYKDPALTAEVMTPDGWFKTGDLGSFDKDNFLYIKGRLKNTLLGANGENIYPEDIESVINNFRHVVESVVIQQKGKLVALVHFNIDEIEKTYKTMYGEMSVKIEKKVDELRKELHEYVNSKVNKFSKIHQVEHEATPFKKTATHKIKRYLYSNRK